MAARKKFSDVMTAMMEEKKPPCAVCNSRDRADIEMAKKAGMPNTDIAKAMFVTGDFEQNTLSQDRASNRVSTHFKDHPLLERVSTK